MASESGRRRFGILSGRCIFCMQNGQLPYERIRAIVEEFGNLLKIQDNYPKLVVTQDDFSGNSYQGIMHESIRNFLML